VIELSRDRERVFGRGVKLRAVLSFHVIFFATDRPDFDLEHQFVLRESLQ
jgi:hypothetical protein